VLSPNDGLAFGVISALKEAGYGNDGKPFPVLTGQDCDIPNVVAIINGEQSMSVFKDTRALASRTVEMIDDIIVKKSAAVNDTKTYDNGVKIVPTYICTPIYVDKDNYKQVLVQSGYYNEGELK
jgi:putative multiple sugar transport system substrate-binding protein